MEKYSRQALAEGVKNVSDLVVSTDCELYRVLVLHYNRNNQIEVYMLTVHLNTSDGKIDSRCRIVTKNSVPQLQRFSYVHHCAAKSRHGSHSRQCRYSLLQRHLAAHVAMRAECRHRPVMASVDWSSSFRTRVQNPWCGLWCGGGSDRAMNRIESNRFLYGRIAHHY